MTEKENKEKEEFKKQMLKEAKEFINQKPTNIKYPGQKSQKNKKHK